MDTVETEVEEAERERSRPRSASRFASCSSAIPVLGSADLSCVSSAKIRSTHFFMSSLGPSLVS